MWAVNKLKIIQPTAVADEDNDPVQNGNRMSIQINTTRSLSCPSTLVACHIIFINWVALLPFKIIQIVI